MLGVREREKILPCTVYMSIVDIIIELRNPDGCTLEKYDDELNFAISLLESRGFTIRE